MRIDAEGGKITAPRTLLINEFDSDEPGSCAVFVLSSPLFVEQGTSIWVEDGQLVVERPSGHREQHGGSWEYRLRRERLL
jgi:hypothetical protein